MKITFTFFLLCLFAHSNPIHAKSSSSTVQLKQFDEIVGLVEVYKPYLDKSIWRKNTEKLRTIIKGGELTSSQFIIATNQLLSSAGVSAPALIKGHSSLLNRIRNPKSPAAEHFVTSYKGGQEYVRYSLLGTKLKRGDKIMSRPASNDPKQTFQVKRSPLQEPITLEIPPVKQSTTAAMFQYMDLSIQTLPAGESSATYIHLIDCGPQSVQLLSRWLTKSPDKAWTVLDLRDSYCADSQQVDKFLTSNIGQRKILAIQNKGTSHGAEHLLIKLKDFLGKKFKSLGEPSAGIWLPRKLLKLKSGELYLYIPSSPDKNGPIVPDYLEKDTFIFSQGQDDLLARALGFLVEQG